jgi:hypothetical protein
MKQTKPVLSAADLDRLVKLCDLFSSDHAGERANAAGLAEQFLRERGLRWPDVLAAPRLAPLASKSPPSNGKDPFAAYGEWRVAAGFCLRHRHLLNNWEDDCCFILLSYPGVKASSPKQRKILHNLSEKLSAAGYQP